jgi:hypothetical protein
MSDSNLLKVFGYARSFSMKRLLSVELQDEIYLNKLRSMGFKWIRQHHPEDYNRVLRCPTVGCIVEVFINRDFGCVKIDSKEGKRMINKVSYF